MVVVESSDVAAEISPTVVFINDIELNHMSMIYIMKYFTIVFVKTISHFISNHYLLNDMLKTWSETD